MMTSSRRKLLLGAAALAATGVAAGAVKTGLDVRHAMGRDPAGKRLERIAASANYRNGAFHNLEPVVDLVDRKDGKRKLLQFFFEDQTGQKPTRPVSSIKTDLETLTDGQMLWFGHSSFFFKLDGLTIVIDPVFHACFPMGNFFAPFAGADIYKSTDIGHVDILILTHDHYDHLDMATVIDLQSRTNRVVCPLGVGSHLAYWGWPEEKITELDWTETTALGHKGKLTCLPSQHFSGRAFKRNQTLWCAYMLEIAGLTIFLSGDGGYGKHFAQIASLWPHIDFGIVEDGQYNEDWAGIHLMPQAWKKAIADLHLPFVMGCHNAKFDLSRHLWIDPLNAAKANADALGVGLVAPKIGQIVRLDRLSEYKTPWWPDSP